MKIKLLKRIYDLISSNTIKWGLLHLLKACNARTRIVRMDTNHLCNLQCKTCYFSSNETKREKEMSPELYFSIAKDVFPKTKMLFLSCYAEPFCSKNIISFIEIAKKQYSIPHVSITTNANLMNSKTIHQLIDSGLDEIVISLAGGTPKTYEETQAGASWDKLWNNIEELHTQKKLRNKSHPKIKINYIATKSSAPEILNLIPLMKQFAINDIHIRELIEYPQMDMTFLTEQRLSSSDLVRFAGNQKTLQQNGISVESSLQCKSDKNSKIHKRYPCLFPFFQLYINAQGKLKFCLFNNWDYTLKNHSLRDILKQEKTKLFFNKLKHLSTCTCIEKCSYYN